jgi:phytoene synthase
MDLDPPRYETFDDLRGYCFHVASAVGLACIHIWGCTDERAIELADTCGVAFQMTNILRDLREDASRGRIYLPREELAKFECDASDLQSTSLNDRLAPLLRFQIERAERLFEEAAPLTEMISDRSRHAFAAMFATYRELLAEIKRRDGNVFSCRVRIGSWRRVRIICSALVRPGATAEGHDRLAHNANAIAPPISSSARKPATHEALRQTGS